MRSGPLGPFRKKTGPIIGRRHKGQNILTSLHHKSRKKPTTDQLEKRLMFGILKGFLSNIKQLVNIGFKKCANKLTPVNAAFSYNYDHAFVVDEGKVYINYPAMVYSRGRTDTPEGPQVTVAENKVVFSWQAQPQSPTCQFSDLASFLIHLPDAGISFIEIGAVNRFAQTYEYNLNNSVNGQTAHCYMNFATADGKMTGNSVYLGMVTCIGGA